MPTFPISNPIQFVIDLLTYLKQGYTYLMSIKTKGGGRTGSVDGILTPSLAANHPQRQKLTTSQSNQDGIKSVLTEYNRSKARNQLEKTVSEGDTNKFDFGNQNGDPVDNIISVLKALVSVIKSNPNVELQCMGHFDVLFGLVSTNFGEKEIKTLGLEIVSLVSRNKECVNEIAACEILGRFLITLKDDELKAMQMKVLETLSGLLNVQRMVKEAQAKGAVIYLLDLFCSSRNPQIREFCAELLGKTTNDKLSGPKVRAAFFYLFEDVKLKLLIFFDIQIRITVCKFLPGVFLDAMIESPQIAVQMFESIHEHPELIWNDKTRDNVIYSVLNHSTNFWKQQVNDPKCLWKDPDTLKDIVTEELVVSGVYLKLFISNPCWTLRKPKQFLSDLLDFVSLNINRTSTQKERDALETSTNALVALLHAQPNLADAVPVLGHIPKFFTQLSVQPKSALKILHQLSLSEVTGVGDALTFLNFKINSYLFNLSNFSLVSQVCVQAISQTECIASLKKCMENNKDLQATTCETLSRLFKCQHVNSSHYHTYSSSSTKQL